MNEQHLSNTLFALGAMGLNWETLPRSLKLSLMAALYRVNFSRDVQLSNSSSSSAAFKPARQWVSKRQKRDNSSSIVPAQPHSSLPMGGLSLSDTSSVDIFFPVAAAAAAVATKSDKSDAASSNETDLMNAQGLSMSVVGLSKLGEGAIMSEPPFLPFTVLLHFAHRSELDHTSRSLR